MHTHNQQITNNGLKDRLTQAEFDALIRTNPHTTSFYRLKAGRSHCRWKIKYIDGNKSQLRTIALQQTLQKIGSSWYWVRYQENQQLVFGSFGIVKDIAPFVAGEAPNFDSPHALVKKEVQKENLLRVYEKTKNQGFKDQYDRTKDMLTDKIIKDDADHEVAILQALGKDAAYSERINKRGEKVIDIVMPKAQEQSLKEILDAHDEELANYNLEMETNPSAPIFKSKYTFITALNYSLNLLEQLYEYQKKGVIHCDIKPPNIFASASENIELIDHGFAQKIAEVNDVHSGTAYYVAPEIYSCEKRVSYTSDAFSVGMTILKMLGDCHLTIIMNTRPKKTDNVTTLFYQNFNEGNTIETLLPYDQFIGSLTECFPNETKILSKKQNAPYLKDLYHALIILTHPDPGQRNIFVGHTVIKKVLYHFQNLVDPSKRCDPRELKWANYHDYAIQQLEWAFSHNRKLQNAAIALCKKQLLKKSEGSNNVSGSEFTENPYLYFLLKEENVVDIEMLVYYFVQSSQKLEDLIVESGSIAADVRRSLESAYKVLKISELAQLNGKLGNFEKLLDKNSKQNWFQESRKGLLFFSTPSIETQTIDDLVHEYQNVTNASEKISKLNKLSSAIKFWNERHMDQNSKRRGVVGKLEEEVMIQLARLTAAPAA